MREVYSPGNAPEAHMLVHLLEQAGIQAHIHGEALQGGVGELPASGFLKILVADGDYDQARMLVQQWEKANPPEASPKRRFRVVHALFFLWLGASLGWGVKAAFDWTGYSPSTAEFASDQNGDGVDDLTFFYRPGDTFPFRSEADNNFDGRIDLRVRYGPEGESQSQTSDDNFDGVFENTTTFQHGLPSKSEIDGDGNDVWDVRYTYVHGIMRSQEILDPRLGVIARINHYENGLLDYAEFDADRDGFLETLRTYDRFGEVTNTQTTRPGRASQ